MTWKIGRERCFLVAELALDPDLSASYSFEPSKRFEEGIRTMIHVPGLRGNPVRTYNTTAFGTTFPGTFEHYVASIIHHWQLREKERLNDLEQMLAQLGLTWKVEAKPVEQTQVELRVGRLPQPLANKNGMVNIADVGFGVSQVLPVLVALLVASPATHLRRDRELGGLVFFSLNPRSTLPPKHNIERGLREKKTAVSRLK